MHRKFNDDIFARCLVIMKNVVISYIKYYLTHCMRRGWWYHVPHSSLFVCVCVVVYVCHDVCPDKSPKIDRVMAD